MSLCEGSLSRICIDLQLALPRRMIPAFLSPGLPFLADAPARQITEPDEMPDCKGRLDRFLCNAVVAHRNDS